MNKIDTNPAALRALLEEWHYRDETDDEKIAINMASVLRAVADEKEAAGNVAALVESLEEIITLCGIGDVDEETEAYGWGEAIKRARAALASAAVTLRRQAPVSAAAKRGIITRVPVSLSAPIESHDAEGGSHG